MTIIEELQAIFADRLKENEPMSRYTNFRIGGPAKYFAEVRTIEELVHALKVAKDVGVEVFVLGGGSNTLVADEGFDGLILKIAMRDYQVDETTVVADAGVLSAMLARTTAKLGLAGFTWAISLPGTIGGAVRGNAGCFGGEIKDNLVSAEVLRDGKIVELSNKDLAFGYRDSSIKHSEDIVLRAKFEFEEADPNILLEELDKHLASRKSSQPLHAGSAGCMFKNWEFEKLGENQKDLDLPESMKKKNQVSCGWLIDVMGLKGTRIGDAEISDEHGNFIINHGKATAKDVLGVIELVKKEALERYGIGLEEEVKLVGF